MNAERWVPIAGFEGRYEVSDAGRVRGVDRMVRRYWGMVRYAGCILKPARDGDGYLKVHLGKNGPQAKVHKLVAAAFCKNPLGLPEVDHKDCDKANNADTNLQWCTKSVNGENRDTAKRIPEPIKVAIQAAVREGMPIVTVARQFSVSRAHVRRLDAAARAAQNPATLER